MRKFIAYAARVVTLATLLGLLYYVVDGDFVLTHDNKKTVQICIEEAERGCPLLLEALEEKAAEAEIEDAARAEAEAAALAASTVTYRI